MIKFNDKLGIIFISGAMMLVLTGCVKAVSEPVVSLPEENQQGDESAEVKAEQSEPVVETQSETTDSDVEDTSLIDKVKNLVTEESDALPATVSLDVAFASQAPHGNWELPYQETCEEASLIIASKYFKKESLNADIMDQELLKLVAWEKTDLGVYTDTDVAEVLVIAQKYFSLNAEMTEDVSVDRIKRELAAGNLIVAPFAGRELGNPNFTAPGPLYHMLVITGYDRNEFITNDVGTRKGEDYKYKYDVLISALHDLPKYDSTGGIFRPYDDTTMTDEAKAQKMLTGVKRMIIING
ncbi:TPA: hypothetical protein DF272_05075 [Candidatus Falkowbacteria bacterium]|nr:hypothetical protein [Candidatus Falkowbacteria bacterium]